MKRILVLTIASMALALSGRNAAAADVTNTITLNYDALSLANGDPIPTPYPGITASASVNHLGVDGGGAEMFVPGGDVTFQGSGFGNLNNVAVAPTVAQPAFGKIIILPADPTSYLRLISFRVATKDDGAGDETSVTFFVNKSDGTPVRSSFEDFILGDANNTVHTLHTFGGTPITGTAGHGFEFFWPARNGRLAVDDFKFEVITPSSIKMIVTLPGETFVSGSGNSGTPNGQSAGVPFTITLTAVTNNNLNQPVIDTSYSGNKTITYSGPGGTPVYTTSVNFVAGQAASIPITLKKAETTTISATDGTVTSVPSSNVTVAAGGFTKLQVLLPGETAAPGTASGKSSTPANQSVGTAFNVTVNAVDANWNLVATNDTIHVTTTDPSDTHPADNALSGGTRNFSITPATAGDWIVSASDVTTPAISSGDSSLLTVVAANVVYPYTLTYDDLGVANNAAVPDPYPGIAAATVTHFGRDQNNVLFEDVFFVDGVTPNRYGDLVNVAKGPSGTPIADPAWGGIRIAPNSPSDHVRLISFKLASLDDDGFDETVAIAVYDPVGGTTDYFIDTVPVPGDFNNSTHTNFAFPPIFFFPQGLGEIPAGREVALIWYAKNGRVAIDDVQFEIIGPVPPTARADFYTVPLGGTTNVSAPGVLGNDSLGGGSGPLTAAFLNGLNLGTVTLTNNGGFAFTSTSTGGMGGFTYRANDGGAVSSPAAALVSVLPPGSLFYDDFARPGNLNELTPWKVLNGPWSVTNGMLLGATNGVVNGDVTGTNHHADVYVTNSWTDYSVEVRASVATNGYGWAVGGRLNPTSGSYYEVFLYANFAPPEQWRLKLTKHTVWGPSGWDGANLANQPDVPLIVDSINRTNPHTIKMTFIGNRILVDFDGVQKFDVTDNNFPHNGTPVPPFLSGGILVGLYNTNNSVFRVEDVIVRLLGPVATDQQVVTPEDTATNLVLQGSIGAGTKTFGIPTGGGPTNGTLGALNATTGEVTYTPDADYFGPDAFRFTVSDGTLYATGLVSITVTPANQPPVVANPIPSQSATYGTAFSFQFALNTFSDPNGDPLTYTASGMPLNITFNGPSRTFSGTPTQVGTFPVQVIASDGGSPNLTATNTFNITVGKATPTATLAVNNSPVTYDGNPKAATVGISASSVPGAVANILTGGAATQTGAGTYAVTANFVPTDTANYNTLVGLGAGNFVINKATPTATLAVNNSPVTYDGNPKAATVGISASSVAGAVANILTGGAATQTGVGTYAVTASFVPTDTANYNTLVGLGAGNFVINKAPLTATGITANDKVYDGTTVATLTGGALLNGVLGDDVVTLSTPIYDNSVSDLFSRFDLEGLEIGDEITLAGPANRVSKFSFEYWAQGPGVNAGNVQVVLRFYKNDGAVVPGVTPEARRPGTVVFKSKPFPITPTDRSVLVYTEQGDFTNAAAADVLLTEMLPTNFTWSVQFIGLGAGDSAGLDLYSPPAIGSSYPDYWEFDGNNWSLLTYFDNPPINFGARLEATITGTFADKNVGADKLVTISGFVLSGADAGNYVLTQPTATADITQAPLVVTADNKARLYGAANPPLTATITGFVNGETLATSGVAGSADLTTPAVPSSPPGNYPVTAAQGTLTALNYSFSFVPGALSVTSGDFDGDGIPDDVEFAYGLNPQSSADATLDSDGDRLTNLQEYLAGTDLTNSSSALRITTIVTEGNDIRVHFTSVVGKSYLIQKNDQYPSSAGWTDVAIGIAGNGGVTNVVDSGANNLPASSRRVYRVTVAGVSSEPVGFCKVGLTANSDTLLSFPVTRPEFAAGLVGSVSGSQIQINGPPDWTANQLVYQTGVQSNTYYLLIRSGALEGLIYTITNNGLDTVTVDSKGVDLAGLGLVAGERVSIIPYWTLGTALASGNGIYPNTNPLPVNNPTEVLLPDLSGIGKNLSASKTFYHWQGAWRAFGEGNANKDDFVLLPTVCVIVRHNVAGDTVCTVSGAVITSKIAVPLAVWASGQQDNFVALPRPTPISLDDSGLISSGAFSASSSPLIHTDELLVFDAALAAKNKSASKTYYYFSGAWREQSAGLANLGGVQVFTPGTAVIIRKAVGAVSPPLWINSPPAN